MRRRHTVYVERDNVLWNTNLSVFFFFLPLQQIFTSYSLHRCHFFFRLYSITIILFYCYNEKSNKITLVLN